MKRIQLLLCSLVAMLMLSVNSVWAQYVKLTAEDGTVSWIEIEGTINSTNIEIYKGISESAIDRLLYINGSIDLNEVWSQSGGEGTHYQVTSIGDFAFFACSFLTSVEIPSSVTSIGNYAFENCFGLVSINIPSSVTSISYNAFEECRGLTSIVVESGNTVYDSRNNCNAIIETVSNTLLAGCKNTKIPSSVTSIGSSAFNGSNGLTSIEIPSSVTSIGYGAFNGCSGLTSIKIPSSVTSIGFSAFWNCSGLTSIVVESGNPVFDSRNNCNAIIETASNTLIAGCTNTKIPSSVTSIGKYAFYLCSGLTSIDIPSSVTSIGESAFSGCYSLTSVVIPSSVTSIGYGAFSYCYDLISMTSYITNVFETGRYAFLDCNNATLYVPDGMVSTYQSTADWNRFNEIKEISDIVSTPYVKLTAEDGTVSWIEIEGIIDGETIEIYKGEWEYAIDYNTKGSIDLNEVWSQSGGEGTHYQVTSIGDFAFSFRTGLTSVIIPNSVTSIGRYAFYDCVGLTSITIPSSVTSIGNTAFSTCMGLTSITIPNSVTSIGDGTFSYCSGLTSIEIPSCVTSIGDVAFYYCTGLTSITSYITDVFETGSDAFNGCENATLYVPRGTKSQYHSTTDWNRISKIVELSNQYDVNDDGSIDISDVVSLVNAILSSSSMLESNDVNGDGNVDISDVVKLVNIILGQ